MSTFFGGYLQSTSPAKWTLDDFANWLAANSSDDKKKIIDHMKKELKSYSDNELIRDDV